MARHKSDKYQISHMVKQIDEYLLHITGQGLRPILKECFLLNEWDEKYVYQMAAKEGNEELSNSINKIVTMKEIFLERELDDPNIKPAGVIFSLKQLGWKDVNGISIEKSGAAMDLVKSIEEMRNANKS